MPSTSGLYVAIYEDEGVYKHWSFFFDGPTPEQKIIFQAMGSSTRYRFERLVSNAREAPELIELIHLCDVPSSGFKAIEKTARNTVIHNEFPGFNCQDYVLDLMENLEKEGIVDINDQSYGENKELAKDKQEGLL